MENNFKIDTLPLLSFIEVLKCCNLSFTDEVVTEMNLWICDLQLEVNCHEFLFFFHVTE